MTEATICIPFRDRGKDPLRQQNLRRVLQHWSSFGAPVMVTDDGREGDEQFCRSAAYNRAAKQTGADVIVYTESDMLISFDQIRKGIRLAARKPGLVVPFTEYRYLTPADSIKVRGHAVTPPNCRPQYVMENGRSIGAINIVSRTTIEAVGQWDETFSGSWFDDRAMQIAFELTAGPTRWVDGPAHHLYHLPGWKGPHLTAADKQATEANKRRYELYVHAGTPERVRQLTAGSQW